MELDREVARLGPREGQEVGRGIDADDIDAPAAQLERVPPGPTTRVEHTHPGPELERVDEEVDLLHGPFGERHYSAGIRCPVGPPKMRRDLVERLRNETKLPVER